MRLLYFNQFKKLVLTHFCGKITPSCAILSHRWGDAEILLEEIGSATYKENKDGYERLKFCAEQAAQEELQFFWIDTRCINRWSLHAVGI